MIGHVFVNYRRSDDAGFAQLLHRLLKDKFESAFIDVNRQIGAGDDFLRTITRQIAACDALVVVIGPRWAQEMRRRRHDDYDFVVSEIEMAVRQGKWIAPVLVGNAKLPAPKAVPERVHGNFQRHAVPLSPVNFESDVERFATELSQRIALAREERARQDELMERNDAHAQAQLAEREQARRKEAASRARKFARSNVSCEAAAERAISVWSVVSPGSLTDAASFAIHLGDALSRLRKSCVIIDMSYDRIAERWADLSQRQETTIAHVAAERLECAITIVEKLGFDCVLLLPPDVGRRFPAALAHSDLVLVPTRNSTLDLMALDELLTYFKEIVARNGFRHVACNAIVIGSGIDARRASMLDIIEVAIRHSVAVAEGIVSNSPEYDRALKKFQSLTAAAGGVGMKEISGVAAQCIAQERRLRGYLKK